MAASAPKVHHQLIRMLQPCKDGACPKQTQLPDEKDDEKQWAIISRRIDDLACAVMQAAEQGEAAAFAIIKLQKVLEYRLDLIHGRFRMP